MTCCKNDCIRTLSYNTCDSRSSASCSCCLYNKLVLKLKVNKIKAYMKIRKFIKKNCYIYLNKKMKILASKYENNHLHYDIMTVVMSYRVIIKK